MSSWVESDSPSFHCRHSSAYEEDAARVLALLERTRERLTRHFPRTAEHLTVVLHDSPTSLALSNPLMPVAWAASGSFARRYVTGWVGRRELHVLSPAALRSRASGLSGSFEMLALTPASLYVRRVIIGCNHDIEHSRVPARGILDLRWAWLLDGASRWFSGESGHGRAIVRQRLRENPRPRFPPTVRDSPVIAPTLMDVLARERGEGAVAQLAGRLHPHGPRPALAKAFSGMSISGVESEWRSDLRKLADSG
jgi:hypothetical protein